MDQNTLRANAEAWSRPLEGPPGRGASDYEVATYLIDELEAGGLLYPYDEWRPITPRQARQFCDDNEHAWKQVSPRVRELRAKEFARGLANAENSVSSGGIVINDSLASKLDAAGWLPMCPVHLTGFSRSTFSHFTICKDCGKPRCRKCGVERLEDLLEAVRLRIAPLGTVFTAQALSEGRKTSDRVRQRHHALAGSEYFWYRRSDDVVFYVSTHPLHGGRSPKPPSDWTSRTPDEVIEWLKTEVLVFPGYRDHDWSAGWKPTRAKLTGIPPSPSIARPSTGGSN